MREHYDFLRIFMLFQNAMQVIFHFQTVFILLLLFFVLFFAIKFFICIFNLLSFDGSRLEGHYTSATFSCIQLMIETGYL